jgi:hypothetical protein
VSDLKQQLEAVRDRMADEELPAQWFFNGEDRYSDADRDNYKAGFNAAIPIILEMAETLHGIKKAKSNGADVYAFADDAKFDADESLNKLKQFVDGGK